MSVKFDGLTWYFSWLPQDEKAESNEQKENEAEESQEIENSGMNWFYAKRQIHTIFKKFSGIF